MTVETCQDIRCVCWHTNWVLSK